MQKQLKILFFINDAVPTSSDRLKASEIPAQVCFRNASYIEGADEKCDGVAGAVPDCYAAFPTAEKAVADYKAALKALSAKVGDEKPPAKKPQENPATDAAIQRNEAAAKPPETPEGKPKPGKPPAWNPNVNPPA